MGTIVFIVISLTLTWIMVRWYQKAMQRSRANRLDQTSFPDALKQKVQQTYPHLNDAQTQQVIEGLRDFFHLCNMAGNRMVAMPSQVVDVAWHEFILNTRRYQRFCQQHLGRFLHHTPAEAMQSRSQAQLSIKRAWRLACKRENIAPKTPHKLPRLFALDAELQITDGFVYQLNCRRTGANSANAAGYCASDIGCSSGCAAGCGGDSDGGSGCGGGCGGGD